MSYIEVKNCYKTYKIGQNIIKANDDINFTIEKNEFVVILGSSGAGKSTMLNLLGGMDRLDSGSIQIDNIDISKYNDKQLIEYRRNDVGFVFQFYNLISNLTAKENVELACELVKNPLNPIEVLNEVGLSNRINNFPTQLSGGEAQRVAIARAIAKNPKILLCDEPTGALDFQTGKQILKLLRNLSKKSTVIVVTHNYEISKIADKVIKFSDGKIKEISINQNIMKVDDLEW